MKLITIKSEGLSHNSYFLADGEEAVVFDPRRDCHVYLRLARENCVKIRFIFETHRNEDYVVGSKELRELTEAEICHSKQLDFRYGQHNLTDGEILSIGDLRIKALYTPGHTNESLCYAISNLKKTDHPLMVFTGDTLFVGAVGRTDLQGKPAQSIQAEKLYDSLQDKLLPLGDDVLVYPAHGAGSVCGSGIGKQAFSTLGYEKKSNPYLTLTKENFVKRCLSQELIVPAYFAKMERYNLEGAPGLYGFPFPKALSVSDFEKEMAETESIVVDTRLPNAFAGSHVRDSLSIWIGGGTAVYTGWVLDYDQRILLVNERRGDVERVLGHFWRQGFDNVYGFLCKGVSKWQEQGKPIGHIRTISVTELRNNLEHYVVLDVREPSEWHQEGTIKGARCIFFADLPSKADELDRNRRYAVICSAGNRSSIAGSMLKRRGFRDVSNVLGGMTAWNRLSYPTVEKEET